MNEIYLIKQETLNNIAAVTRQKMGAAAEEKIRITELAQKIENIPTTNITQTPQLIEFANARIFNSSDYELYDENASFGQGESIVETPQYFQPALLENTQYIIQLGQLNQNAELFSYIGEIKDNEKYNNVSSAICIYGEHFITNKPIMFFLQYAQEGDNVPVISCYGYGKDEKWFEYNYAHDSKKNTWNWISSSGEGKVNVDVINGKYKNVKIIDWPSMAPPGALENMAPNLKFNYTTSLELLQSFKIINSPLYDVQPWDFPSETE